MSSSRAPARGALAVLLAAAAPSACRDNPSPADTSPSAAASAEIERPAPELAIFPADYDVVMGLDLTQWLETSIASLLAEKIARVDPSGFAQLARDCRPLAAVSTVWAGVRIEGDDERDVLVRIHGAPRTLVVPCIERLVALDGEPTTITRDGDLDAIEYAPGSVAYLAWTDDSTALLGRDPAFLRERRAASRGLDGNPRAVASWHEVDRSAVFWGMAALDEAAATSLGMDVEAGHWSMARSEGLVLKATLTFADSDDARQALKELEALAKADDTVGLTTTIKGRDLQIHSVMDRAQIAKLIGELEEDVDWSELTEIFGKPTAGRSGEEPEVPSVPGAPGVPSGEPSGAPIEIRSFESSFVKSRFGEYSLSSIIEIRVLTDMPHVAPDLNVLATCDGITDDTDAFFMELNGAKTGAILRENLELFSVDSFNAPPASCELSLQLPKTSMKLQYFCVRGGVTIEGRCGAAKPETITP